MISARTLYVVSCAAPPALNVNRGIAAAQKAGWDVCLVLTPSAYRWLEADIPELEELTGHPVRHEYKSPGSPDILPAADAILVAPATLNTITKWADGHADTLALGLITEAIGLGMPLVCLPYINSAQAAHPALPRAVDILRATGVTVMLGEGGHTPHMPKHGNADAYPWAAAMSQLPVLTQHRLAGPTAPEGA